MTHGPDPDTPTPEASDPGSDASDPQATPPLEPDPDFHVEDHLAAPSAQWWQPRQWWPSARYFVVHKVLHADDSPHRLALGAAIGMWVALLPLVGVQMIVSATLCHPFKGNKVVGMAMAWVSNPLTLIPCYLPMYWLGCWLLGLDAIPYDDFVAIFFPDEGTWVARVSATWRAMLGIFGPLWLGSGIIATVVAIPTYFVSERLITAYRLRRYGTVDLSSVPTPPTSPAD